MSQDNQTNKYPNTFLAGAVCGAVAQGLSRAGTFERLSARPFSYVTTALTLGTAFWYYEYFRRRSVEELLYAEDRRRYALMVKGMNKVRSGEEYEIRSMIDYLSNTTVQE
eukprot:403331156